MNEAKTSKPTRKYKYCNHHHEITKNQEIIDFGTGKFVADKPMIPLLKALNEIGLITRTHNYDDDSGIHFIGIILDNVGIEVNKTFERDADRTKFNGKTQLLLRWTKQ